MPIYEYQCDDCGALIEAFQKITDDALTECEKCGGPLRRVLHPVAIHFKGSGFYTTDYGKGSGRRAGARDPGSSDTPSGSSDGPSGDGGSSSGEGAAKSDEGKGKEKQKAT